jgi:hypothetical protein
MGENNPYDQWEEACWRAVEYVKAASFEDAGSIAIETAKELLAVAHSLKGVACSACSGRGEITYGDTSTWRRATGAGQMLTSDVCERCWGTGRADRMGPDLRRIKSVEHQNEDLFLKNKSLAFEKLELLEKICKWKEATGLEKGGDPDGVTPDDLHNEITHLRATQEKSWGVADEALIAEYEIEKAKIFLTIESFCQKCEYRPDPGSCEDCPLFSLTGGPTKKDSTRLTDEPVNSGSCNDGDLAPKCERS